MEISIKQITLFSAVLLTGLSAGLFYAWSVSVIPGTRRVTDMVYLETMQSINRAIINPAFMLIFLGSMILLVASTAQYYHSGLTFWLLLGAIITYMFGTIGVTGMGNVPLNNMLDVLPLKELNIEQIAAARAQYEPQWNHLHTIRTVFSVMSFALSIIAAISSSKSI